MIYGFVSQTFNYSNNWAYFSRNTLHHISIYKDSIYIPNILSLLKDNALKESFISAMRVAIFNRIKNLPDTCIEKLDWNQFIVILKLLIKKSLEIAENLAQLKNLSSIIEGTL